MIILSILKGMASRKRQQALWGGNLLLELLKDFVGRLTPNDKKVSVIEV